MKFAYLVWGLFLFSGLAWGQPDDPFLWLEEVEGEKAMAWANEQSQTTTEILKAVPEYPSILKRTIEIMDSKARIPMPNIQGSSIYNFWRDEKHPRGIWRRTTLDSYKTEEPDWDVVLDMDALVKKDGIPWVFHGANFLEPERRICLLALSRGGSDAEVIKEFDTQTKTFVEGGFEIPEAKSNVAWRDRDHLLVATDFGEGSLTKSGYPRIVKVWKRGTKLDQAETLFQGREDDVLVIPVTSHKPEGFYEMIVRIPVFYRQDTFLSLGNRLVKLQNISGWVLARHRVC